MDKLVVYGGSSVPPIKGKLTISGSKNAVLPIMAASLLIEEKVVLSRMPHLRDVTTMMELLGMLGVQVLVDEYMNVEMNAGGPIHSVAPYHLVKTMRASFLVLGALLARLGEATVSLPGGCAIGSRPVELHLQALKALGAEITMEHGNVKATAPNGLKGARIQMPKVSVMATENTMMAAVLAKGTTIIEGAACEPEVIDLADFLISMGAVISGAGTSVITIEGVDRLRGGYFTVQSDRIEAGTFLIAAAMNRGSVTLESVDTRYLNAVVLDSLEKAGAHISLGEDSVHLDMRGNRPKAVSVATGPYPGFPTDLQAQWVALNAVAEGSAVVTESVFENRFMHVHEMVRMGANLSLNGNAIHSEGVEWLSGARVMATDLRASASLVLAAMQAEGETEISRIYHIDRGYEHIEGKFGSLGVQIVRLPEHQKAMWAHDTVAIS